LTVPADAEDDAWSPAKLQVGDWFDCKDRLGTWMIAQVIAKPADENELRIRFKGYGSRWDQTIKLSETSRMAPLGSHDAASGRRVTLGAPWALAVEDLEEYEEQLTAMMRGEMDPEDKDSFCKTLLPAFVERNMRCKHTGTATVDRVNEFFQRVLPVRCPLFHFYHEHASHLLCRVVVGALLVSRVPQYIIQQFRQPAPLTPQVTFMWEQLCLGDAAASYFFNRTGTVTPASRTAEAVRGAFSRVPAGKASPHFVANMNRFGELGGYEAIMQRLEREEPRVSLKELRLFTCLLMLARWCYTKRFRVPYFTRLRNAVYKRLQALTDEELQELDQSVVDKIYSDLHTLLSVVLDDEDVGEMMELLQVCAREKVCEREDVGQCGDVSPFVVSRCLSLSFCNPQLAVVRRYLHCPYIVKRIKGLSMLVATIKQVTLSEMAVPHGEHDDLDLDIQPTWLTSKQLAKWIVDSRVVEVRIACRM